MEPTLHFRDERPISGNSRDSKLRRAFSLHVKSMQKAATAMRGSRVLQVMRTIRAELEMEWGNLDWDVVAEWTGEARSTAFERFHREKQSQVEGFLRLLERLPPSARNRVFDALRTYPTFHHPRLAHDQTQLSALSTLLEKRNGTTVIYGANAEDRTFLVTAMARTLGEMIQGFDVHSQRWFVGVPGISYLETLLPAVRLQTWAKTDASKPVILYNGIFLKIPAEYQRRMKALAKDHHLLVVDAFDDAKEEDWCPPLHTVRVTNGKNEHIFASVDAC